MLSIGNFFDKFKNAASEEIALRRMVITAVYKHVPVELNLKNITVRNKIVRIDGNSSLKNQIFIKKESILKSIQESNPNVIITDIR